MLGPLFSAVPVAREHLKRMVDAGRTGVCSVVNTDLVDCRLVAILLCRLRDADRVHLGEPCAKRERAKQYSLAPFSMSQWWRAAQTS